MEYSLTIHNSSGADQNIALFQADALKSGFPLIWLSKKISNDNHHTFDWSIIWGLGYGSTSQPLDVGVSYVSQKMMQVRPNDASGVNEIHIKYDDQNFTFSEPYYNDKIESGVMQIITDTSFTVEDSLKMSVAVYMKNKPILVSQGRPNYQYQFYTNTIYYLTVTDIPEGSVLPVFTSSNSSMMKFISQPNSAISKPTKVNFSASKNELRYNLNNLLVFECDS
ncbi:hypothetical protein GNF10_35055 [Nostoc sp. UCD121]|uniref:hypothetical protein n=1 Tax=unclassified Nostoc TaxID=2593658 RepID=UPI001625F536|nr:MULTISPECIES: hypothetical protein [unclassified Nostoc]MBC1225420.1 hypothetical protein [Nostoc sp. UCD120]MBC1281010.1 hypothetical protein [Nostoc sp. UCD121]